MTKRNILVLTPVLPYPPDSGGNIRNYNIIKRLAKTFNIHLLPYYWGLPNVEYGDALKEETGIQEIHWIRKCSKQPVSALVSKRINFWRNAPHGISLCEDVNYAFTLRSILKEIGFDAIIIELIYMFQYRKYVNRIPLFFTSHDIESLKVKRWFENEQFGRKRRLLHFLQRIVLRWYESRVGGLTEAVFLASEKDRDILSRMNRSGNFIVAPNGVDLDYFSLRSKDSFSGPPKILFLGSLFYKPNMDAAIFLKDQVFPLVQAKIPDATLHIVGKTLGRDFSSWHAPEHGIFMHGRVPDVRPFLTSCLIMPVPIFVGSGTRIKILEAMASGTPVVSTTIGAEGIHYKDGHNIIISDTPQEMSNQIVRLCTEREACFQMGRNGRKLVEKYYSWDVAAGVMKDAIETVLEQRIQRT